MIQEGTYLSVQNNNILKINMIQSSDELVAGRVVLSVKVKVNFRL